MGPGALAAIAAAIRLVFSLNTLNLHPLNILPLQNTQGTLFVNPFFSPFFLPSLSSVTGRPGSVPARDLRSGSRDPSSTG